MITAVILAAGASKRFGRNKLLEMINGKPMIRWVVESALNSMVDEVIVVLGFEAERVAETIKDLPCKIVVNENYKEGMSSSVKCGLRNTMNKSMAILVIPGDCPLIRSEDMNKVINRYLAAYPSKWDVSYGGISLFATISSAKTLFTALSIDTSSTSSTGFICFKAFSRAISVGVYLKFLLVYIVDSSTSY
jgi:molybdopterin-guanine dinucleotide biosynthesis protein A